MPPRYRPSTCTIRRLMPDHAPYIIEPMALADVAQVMEIERVAFPTPWSARAYRYEIAENERSTMLVVRPAHQFNGWPARLAHHLRLAKPERLLGYAGFWLLADDAHVCTIAVHPRWRGLGLGRLLLLSLLEQAIEQGAHRAILEVRVSNRSAQRLYHKYGFEIVSRRRRYYANNHEDAYIMVTPPFEASEFQTNLCRCRDRLHVCLQNADSPQSANRLDKTFQMR